MEKHMTVKKLKEILELFPDDKEVVIEIEPDYYNLRSVFEDKEGNVVVVSRDKKDSKDPNFSPFFSFDSDLIEFVDSLMEKLQWKKKSPEEQEKKDFFKFFYKEMDKTLKKDNLASVFSADYYLNEKQIAEFIDKEHHKKITITGSKFLFRLYSENMEDSKSKQEERGGGIMVVIQHLMSFHRPDAAFSLIAQLAKYIGGDLESYFSKLKKGEVKNHENKKNN